MLDLPLNLRRENHMLYHILTHKLAEMKPLNEK